MPSVHSTLAATRKKYAKYKQGSRNLISNYQDMLNLRNATIADQDAQIVTKDLAIADLNIRLQALQTRNVELATSLGNAKRGS